MFFYYRGWGWLVILFFFVGFMSPMILDQMIHGNNDFVHSVDWPWVVSMTVSSCFIWPLGVYLNKRETRHDFMFVKMQLWAFILPILTLLVNLIMD